MFLKRKTFLLATIYLHLKTSEMGLDHADGCQEIQFGRGNSGSPLTTYDTGKHHESQD